MYPPRTDASSIRADCHRRSHMVRLTPCGQTSDAGVDTALHLAARNRHVEVCRVLMQDRTAGLAHVENMSKAKPEHFVSGTLRRIMHPSRMDRDYVEEKCTPLVRCSHSIPLLPCLTARTRMSIVEVSMRLRPSG